MKYHNITKDDMLNGNGIRVVLWVSGCEHHCPECQNPITWDPNVGIEFDDSAKQEIFAELEKDYVSGITLSGGDPMHPCNRFEIFKLVKEIKEKFPNKTIWMYTGYRFEDIRIFQVIHDIDVLVDGRYEKDKRDVNLHWKGSSNQRVIDTKETFRIGEIVLRD